ncbi:MAG: Lrp/AsnC family transcriptional regulator [Anaerolineales bacterium]|nr:Lrp/AsnC family transcriptional regulator [Anaerolineales bacterium]
MNMDEISLEIIKHLRDGRKSFGEIGKNLSITTNTVRARVKKLMKKGVLETIGSIDPEKIDNHFLVIVGVKLKTMRLVDKGEEFSKLKGVISVAVVTGRFDLILTVLLNNKFGLHEFYTQEVSKIEDVMSTETFVVYKNYNWKVPYGL